MSVAAIEVDGVTKRYGRLTALDQVSLRIEPGEFFGLLGPNGAGKTTLISVIAGLSRPNAGTVRVHGSDVITQFRTARRTLGVVPQELVFDPFFTVRETLRYQSGYYGLANNDAWIDVLLDNLDLKSKADANMRALSGGMKRRVLVAQALVHRPPVIVLDEPTAGVDVELRQTLWSFVRRLNREGHTIVLTTHYLEEAEQLCQRIAMLKAGRIVVLDRTESLIKRFSGSKLLLRLRWPGADGEFPAGQSASTLLPDALRVLELPSEPVGDPSRVALRIDRFDDVGAITGALRLAGIEIGDMELVHTDLEDVFVRVMNGDKP